MQYYFSARYSPTDTDSTNRYKKVVSQLASMGHTNTNYVHMPHSSHEYIQIIQRIARGEKPILDLQLEYLLNSDALICDLTIPSTTVGFQISSAISGKIPCLVLIFTKGDSDEEMIDPVILTQQHLGLVKYAKISHVEEIDSIIDEFVAEYVERPYKFNFFLPLSTHNAVAKRARVLGVTKSELIRKIIDNYINSQESQ